MLSVLCYPMSHFKLSIKGVSILIVNSANTSIQRPVTIFIFSEFFAPQKAGLQFLVTHQVGVV
jgi:hypothetical protein